MKKMVIGFIAPAHSNNHLQDHVDSCWNVQPKYRNILVKLIIIAVTKRRQCVKNHYSIRQTTVVYFQCWGHRCYKIPSHFPSILDLQLWRKLTRREKYRNAEFFLTCVFPHSNWIRRDTEYLSVSLRIQFECGKTRTRKNSVFGYFSRSVTTHAWFNWRKITTAIFLLVNRGYLMSEIFSMKNEGFRSQKSAICTALFLLRSLFSVIPSIFKEIDRI